MISKSVSKRHKLCPKVILFCSSDALTEVWNLVEESKQVRIPTLERNQYAYGIALFLVNRDFCKK